MIWLLMILIAVLTAQDRKIRVVTTLTTYADIARKIGGEYVEVEAIVPGNQDAHFVRPKPSFAKKLAEADLFVSTGLDLELWVPPLLDMSKNPRIQYGQPGYVSAAAGIDLLEKPRNVSRSEGDIHIYGNPHINTSPVNLIIVAQNITTGLIAVDPDHEKVYRENLKQFTEEMDRRLFGDQLVRLLGASTLHQLAASGELYDFLGKNAFQGKPLISYLDGWMKEGMELRGKKIVAYHKNWVYLAKMFGIQVIGYVEPKPGIPPSPRHVEQLLETIKRENVRVILAASYFDRKKVMNIADRSGARAVILPMYIQEEGPYGDIFSLFDYWIKTLKQALTE